MTMITTHCHHSLTVMHTGCVLMFFISAEFFCVLRRYSRCRFHRGVWSEPCCLHGLGRRLYCTVYGGEGGAWGSGDVGEWRFRFGEREVVGRRVGRWGVVEIGWGKVLQMRVRISGS